ncbi:MAG: WecB/TagA/CpsF family glycosyltransferase [Verrucomicrobiota bacterium]|nr:WecB/TagA/CpsF family glycosyltransferase [Verrucomicrobiota bacterium]
MHKQTIHQRLEGHPPIVMLGVPFDNVTTAETICLIEEMIRSGRPHYLATANVDFLVQASRDVELRRILLDAHLVLCDGTPLVWASKILGNPLPERVAGSDLIPILLQVAAERGFRPFFLGATPEVAARAVKLVSEHYPGIQIAGHYSPPFNKLIEMDHEAITQRIREAKPDMLFVGFGCPKQEKWIAMHYQSLGVPVSVGVGATIDFLAGHVRRAPRWMQKSGTEWIFRLLQEPGRLLKRYSTDLRYFSVAIVKQWWKLRYRQQSSEAPRTVEVQETKSWKLLSPSTRLDAQTVQQTSRIWEEALLRHQFCFIDLSRVEFIDSTGIGLLVKVQKQARKHHRHLVLINASETVIRSLELMKLRDFFLHAPDLSTAQHLMEPANQMKPVILGNSPHAVLPALFWQGECVAANAHEFWELTRSQIMARSEMGADLAIDLTNLKFIDSSGLSVMLRARKFAQAQGIQLVFAAPGELVLNVLKLAQLEEYLVKK